MTKDFFDSSVEMYVRAALGKKPTGLLVLDLRKIISYTDVAIICSGRSNRQVTAIAEYIKTELKTKGKLPLGVEGFKEGRWALLDYGHVIIHVFYESVREFYNLEGMWADAEKVDVSHIQIQASENDTVYDDDDYSDEDDE